MPADMRLMLTHTDPWRVLPECWSSWHQCFRRQWQWQLGQLQFLPAGRILQCKQWGQPGVKLGVRLELSKK